MKKNNLSILIGFLFIGLVTACTGNQQVLPVETIQPLSQDENSATSEPIEPTLAVGEVIVSTLTDFQAAVADQDITRIHIVSVLDLSSEVSFERNDDLDILIEQGGTLIVNALFSPVACTITNEGEIEVNNSFERGISTLTNNGSMIIHAGGIIGSGMSNTENHGSIVVEQDGELVIDRGSIFNNFGELVNTGHVLIDNGGQFNDEGGTLVNDGVVDVNAYFNGDISKITGTGILNDNRE